MTTWAEQNGVSASNRRNLDGKEVGREIAKRGDVSGWEQGREGLEEF
jgi:hypothetical protein